jgi:hypothetical protein
VAARCLYSGVEALAGSSVETARACAFLAAQSLECALKSYLSHAGVGESRIKNHLRHNLESLWIEAVKYHLNIQSQPPQWCVILNSVHDKPYYLRYPMGINGIELPELIPMAYDLKDILAVVEHAIRV